MDAATKDEAATTKRKASSWKHLGSPGLDQPTPEAGPLGLCGERSPSVSLGGFTGWGWRFSYSELTSQSTGSGKALGPSTEAGAKLAQHQ